MSKTAHTPKLMVHSGECCICEVGLVTGATDDNGKRIHTGDIVTLYLADGICGGLELIQPLTVVVANQFTSYSDGSVRLHDGPHNFFTMGIKDEGISSPKWIVFIAKKFHDVVDGEHWPAYGFSYRENLAAEAALAEASETTEVA